MIAHLGNLVFFYVQKIWLKLLYL